MFGLFKPKKLSEEDFAEEIAARLRKLPTIARVNLGSTEFALDIWDVGAETDGPRQSYLFNAYRHYDQHGHKKADQEDILTEWVQSFATLPEDVAITHAGLLPMVRNVGYASHINPEVIDHLNDPEGFPADYEGPVLRPFVGDLVISLAHDSPTMLSYLSTSDLEEVGLTVDAAWDVAFENLDKILEFQIEQHTDDGIVLMDMPDTPWMTGSLLLGVGIFDEFMTNNDLESLYVCHPCRNAIFFTGTNLDHGLDAMVATMRFYLKEDHPQSNFIFKVHKGKFEFDLVTMVDDEGQIIPLENG